MRVLLLGLLPLLGLAGARWAAAGEEPAPRRLEGAPALVTPPRGSWTEHVRTVAPGQWLVEYRSADGRSLVRAHVFPVRHAREPEPLLVQAVDLFFRGLGVDGFGLTSRVPLVVWGCRAAQGDLAAVVAGAPVAGHARLLLASRHQWAFVVGYAGRDAPADRRAAVRAFVESLEPIEPRFYTRTFRRASDDDTVLVRVPGEEPLTEAHLVAIRTLLEAGLGARFPGDRRELVREVLLTEARTGGPRTREGFRASRDALVTMLKVPAQEAAVRALGRRILQAILDRASEGQAHAQRFARAWRVMQQVAVGRAEDGLTRGVLAHLIETAAFLASIAADRAVGADAAARRRLTEDLVARWTHLAPEDRKALRTAGETAAALRYAWDQAQPDRRRAFRRAVAARLAPVDQRAHVAALDPGRPLWRWMHTRPPDGLDAALLDAAFELTPTDWRRWIDVLQVADAFALHPGW